MEICTHGVLVHVANLVTQTLRVSLQMKMDTLTNQFQDVSL